MTASTRVVRFQVEFPFTSALPADVTVNTWHMHNNPVGSFPVDLSNAFDMLEDFYTVFPAGEGQDVAEFFAPYVQEVGLITAYSLDDPEPRVPIGTRALTFTRSGTDALPAEVALVASFQGDVLSGENQASRRGRVFLGPFAALSPSVIDATGRPGGTLRTVVAKAARDLLAASDASTNWDVGVDSPTRRALATGPDSFTAYTNGWVDNAWDTQRRRGHEPTSRILITDVLPA